MNARDIVSLKVRRVENRLKVLLSDGFPLMNTLVQLQRQGAVMDSHHPCPRQHCVNIMCNICQTISKDVEASVFIISRCGCEDISYF